MNKIPADGSTADGGCFAITLCSSSVPMPLHVPFAHELLGFSVFRSRTNQDGRERFRLHLGFFDSAARGRAALAVVRRYYPTAWLSNAPRAGLGSLDDTMKAAFQIFPHGNARLVTAEDFVPQSRVAVPENRLPASLLPTVDQQRYVVQLIDSAVPIRVMDIPRLPVLRAYQPYRVQSPSGGGPINALRLGFFVKVEAAQQIAEYVRCHFPTARVVPISGREFTRATELIRAHEQKARAKEERAKRLDLASKAARQSERLANTSADSNRRAD